MPITPPAASLRDVRPDLPQLYVVREYSSRYGRTTRYNSPANGLTVIHHKYQADHTPTPADAHSFSNVITPPPDAHVVLDIKYCQPPETGLLEALATACPPDVTFTLITREKAASDQWLHEEGARLSLLEILTDSTDLRKVIQTEPLSPWAPDEHGLALANIVTALTQLGHRLDYRFDGRVAEGFKQFWTGNDLDGITLSDFGSLAQMVQWAFEGMRADDGTGSDEPALTHRQLDRIAAALNELLTAIEAAKADDDEDETAPE